MQEYFERYGVVEEATIMMDHVTNRSRGFGFVLFGAARTLSILISPHLTLYTAPTFHLACPFVHVMTPQLIRLSSLQRARTQ